jgi:twitching motility protein PilT
MQTLDGSLLKLLREKKVDYEHALVKSSNTAEFHRRAEKEGLAEATNLAH